jgi:CHAT domain
MVLYNDFAVTIADSQGAGYPVSAVAQALGRVSWILPPVDGTLAGLLAQVAEQAVTGGGTDNATKAGSALFRWLMGGPLDAQLRLAWDRAARAGHGLRLRLSIDPPEIAALPWELLNDPQRDHCFAIAASTLLVRFLDQTGFFGALAEQLAELPLHMLLVLPQVPDLNLTQERALIEEAIRPLQDIVLLHVLEGSVTRSMLSDALLAVPYDILHLTGHGAFEDGVGYIGLNQSDGSPDWVDARALVRLLGNQRSIKLLLLNSCSTGRVDAGAAFRGLAPQIVRSGVPAVAAMQYPLTDAAALTFARAFYRQLCTGENAGQVDVAITYARNMLAVMHPNDYSFAAPVLYTHASNGIIYTLAPRTTARTSPDPGSDGARLTMFTGSIDSSKRFNEDWLLAEPHMLEEWRRTLAWAEKAYTLHLDNARPAMQQAARQGLTLIQRRLATLDERVAH